jgi:hypothetical protein
VGELATRRGLALGWASQGCGQVLGARKELHRAVAVITGGHRGAADVDALRPISTPGKGSQCVSFAIPVVPGELSPVAVSLSGAHVAFGSDHQSSTSPDRVESFLY